MIIGIDSIRRFWQRVIDPQAYVSLFNDIGLVITDSIQIKTASGYDYLNNKFSPYTDAYKRWKVSKGHSGRVNLRLTGQMLDSLVSKPEPKGVVITFDNQKANDKANYNENGRTPRRFMGIPPEVEKQIDDMVEKHIDDLLNGI